jgi:hypothetical protein
VAAALAGRRDGEPLQVAVPRRGARDRERDELAVVVGARREAGAGTMDRRRPADLGEVGGVVAPRVTERVAIDARRLDVAAGAQRRRRTSPGPPSGHGVEVDAQEGEGVDHVEPGGAEAVGRVGEQGAGADGVARRILGAERVDPAADLVDAGHDALVGEGKLHDARIERPRPHPDARSEPGVHGMAPDLHGC